MGKFLEKLVSISSKPLSSTTQEVSNVLHGVSTDSLRELLGKKNGFYAFESALHVFPCRSTADEIGLMEWNDPALWIDEYAGLAAGAVFFAEDVFGGQFCLKSDGCYSFDPETARFDFMAANLEDWAKLVLEDYEFLTGYAVAHEWQKSRGLLVPGMRLAPKTPFVVGGKYMVENLAAMDAVRAMHFRATLAVQIHGLPDGAEIQWRIED